MLDVINPIIYKYELKHEAYDRRRFKDLMEKSFKFFAMSPEEANGVLVKRLMEGRWKYELKHGALYRKRYRFPKVRRVYAPLITHEMFTRNNGHYILKHK